MTLAAAQNPIRIGILFDFVFPPPGSWDIKADFLDALRLRLDEALEDGLVDRPVEWVLREVEGLPRGNVKAVVDAHRELADAGCLLIVGPMISENAVALKEHIEADTRIPSITWSGSDDWLGEWTFSLSNGSLPDEPYVVANLIAHAGHRRVAVSVERSLIGEEYLRFFRAAARVERLEIVAEVPIAQTDADATDVTARLKAAEPDAIVHLGFGLGMARINEALRGLEWNPPKFTTSAWENGYMNDDLFRAFGGWIGLEQYDEENPVAVDFLDRFDKRYGRRPQYFTPGYAHDVGSVVAQALGGAAPLSPRGVKEAIERVKMLPAASGAPGTRISYGKWTRRGWMGPSYMVAREVAEDVQSTAFRGRIGPPRRW